MSDNIEIVTSTTNTAEMAAKFPVIHPTPIESKMEKGIQNRLLNGFENWNRGIEAWQKWCGTLYTDASIYNVHSVRLTMDGYKTAMRATLRNNDIQMGDFHNMLISGDWAAIHYDIANVNRETGAVKPGTVMEFVKFADYGPELGVRVVEGWAGTKGSDFRGLSMIQRPAEKEVQDKILDGVLNTVIPDTDDLAVKYPVTYPTPIETPLARKIRDVILQDFDQFNRGYEAWSAWADNFCTADFQYTRDNDGLAGLSLAQYKETVASQAASKDVKRVSFDSLIVSGDWAAVHYRFTSTDKATGEKDVGDVMQFIHFVEDGDGVKAAAVWTK